MNETMPASDNAIKKTIGGIGLRIDHAEIGVPGPMLLGIEYLAFLAEREVAHLRAPL